MNIGIDIDDTISNTFENSVEYAKNYVRSVIKKEPIIDMTKVRNHYYIRDMFNLTTEEDKTFWKKHYNLIINSVTPKESSVEVINKLKEEGNKIIIITARWSDEDIDAYKISKNWLEKHNIKYDKLFVGIENKAEVAIDECLDLFIDDSIKNCEEVTEAKIKSYLFSSQTNKHINPNEQIIVVNSWDDIYEKLKVM